MNPNQNPIRVLEVIRQGQIGGGESHVLDLIHCLNKEQVEPIALAFTGGHMIDTLRAKGIKCYVIETSKAFDWKVQKQLKELIQKEKIQIIHAHGSRAASNMVWPSYTTGIPMVYTVHGWSFHQDQSVLVQKVRGWSEKLICSVSKRNICVSESNRITGVETFGLSNCSVIENGINLDRFNQSGNNKNLRTEFGFTEEDFIVGEIARITLQKAPLDFIKSIEIVHQKNPKIKGILIGEGDMLDEAYAYIKEHNMQEYLKTSPFRTDVPDVLHTIDVYCLPSLWEGLSIALLEAMAMMKPIVVTPTDGTKEIITDQVNGTIVPFNAPEKLADAYLNYFNNPDVRKNHGREAMSVIEKRFNAQRVADQVTEIYKEVL